jgi:prepilin-type N-terminal cleavage/methylation domain-containing protein
MKKVKAFTIMEMTIAMLISAIVIGITYSAFSIISRSYAIYQTKNEGLAVLSRVDHLLAKDFAHAEMVSKTSDGVAFTSRSDSVSYMFGPDFIVRKNTITDTFKVQTTGLGTLFESQPLNEVKTDGEQNRIDELVFFIVLKDGNIPYHYQKRYSSENLLNRNPNAVH